MTKEEYESTPCVYRENTRGGHETHMIVMPGNGYRTHCFKCRHCGAQVDRVTCVAFMQNQWLKNAETHQRTLDNVKKDNIDRWFAYRRRMIPFALFAGCKSGRVIKKHLSTVIRGRIIWDEASPTICNSPAGCPPADIQHMNQVLEYYQPMLVFTLGQMASKAHMNQSR